MPTGQLALHVALYHIGVSLLHLHPEVVVVCPVPVGDDPLGQHEPLTGTTPPTHEVSAVEVQATVAPVSTVQVVHEPAFKKVLIPHVHTLPV